MTNKADDERERARAWRDKRQLPLVDYKKDDADDKPRRRRRAATTSPAPRATGSRVK